MSILSPTEAAQNTAPDNQSYAALKKLITEKGASSTDAAVRAKPTTR